MFPSGGVEAGESPALAAARGAWEELGLRVAIRRLVARVTPARVTDTAAGARTTDVFLADITGGTFGAGQGAEPAGRRPERGTYRPRWLPFAALLGLPVYPRGVARLVLTASTAGWPTEPSDLSEDE